MLLFHAIPRHESVCVVLVHEYMHVRIVHNSACRCGSRVQIRLPIHFQFNTSFLSGCEDAASALTAAAAEEIFRRSSGYGGTMLESHRDKGGQEWNSSFEACIEFTASTHFCYTPQGVFKKLTHTHMMHMLPASFFPLNNGWNGNYAGEGTPALSFLA